MLKVTLISMAFDLMSDSQFALRKPYTCVADNIQQDPSVRFLFPPFVKIEDLLSFSG